MRVETAKVRTVLAMGTLSLLAGCVQPVYVQPGPVQLQGYPPPVSYRSNPDYRPPIGGPIALQPAPVIQPLPPAIPALPPSVTEVPEGDLGPIPVQDMPAPTSDAVRPAEATPEVTPTPSPSAPPEIIRKIPASGPGNNVPLEGFRPMKGQTRPAP